MQHEHAADVISHSMFVPACHHAGVYARCAVRLGTPNPVVVQLLAAIVLWQGGGSDGGVKSQNARRLLAADNAGQDTG